MAPEGSKLWALLVEYDGGPFVGWQRQDSGLSVQEVIEAAIRSHEMGSVVDVPAVSAA